MIPAEDLAALSSSLISPALEQLADPPAGDRELQAAGIVAVVAESRSFATIGEWVAGAPPHVLGSLGIRAGR